jgi:hypothetical protein
MRLELGPDGKITVDDAAYRSWYGNRHQSIDIYPDSGERKHGNWMMSQS